MLPLPDLGGIIAPMSRSSPRPLTRCAGPCGWIQRSMYSERTVSSRLPLAAEDDRTEVGSYFVATYPPFSVWTAAAVEGDARPALQSKPAPGVPARDVSPHPFLPETVPLLLLPRVHRQERAGGSGVSRRARAGMGALRRNCPPSPAVR